jgi:hypothetical protein
MSSLPIFLRVRLWLRRLEMASSRPVFVYAGHSPYAPPKSQTVSGPTPLARGLPLSQVAALQKTIPPLLVLWYLGRSVGSSEGIWLRGDSQRPWSAFKTGPPVHVCCAATFEQRVDCSSSIQASGEGFGLVPGLQRALLRNAPWLNHPYFHIRIHTFDALGV